MSGQCPTCGRVDKDWKSESSVKRAPDGTKLEQRVGTERSRTSDYQDWHRTLGADFLVNDIDQIEWRLDANRNVFPVAVIELSRVDGNMTVPDSYLDAAWDRFSVRDPQSKVTALVAARLGVPAFFTLYRHDMTQFWVYEIYHPQRYSTWFWDHKTEAEYRKFVIELTPESGLL